MKQNRGFNEEPEGVKRTKEFDPQTWKPKTNLGTLVKSGQITNLDDILNSGYKILEPEIIDLLLANLEKDLLSIGQSKGKFGGGKSSIWRQTQKKTEEGKNIHFTAGCIIGNKNGFIGLGFGKSRETVPAREKSIKQAKLNILKIRRGCGSWDCNCRTPHSIPYKVVGSCGSVRIELIPAPKGTELIIGKECKKILKFAGIKDVYSRCHGHTGTKINLVKACFEALRNLSHVKTMPSSIEKIGIVDGAV